MACAVHLGCVVATEVGKQLLQQPLKGQIFSFILSQVSPNKIFIVYALMDRSTA